MSIHHRATRWLYVSSGNGQRNEQDALGEALLMRDRGSQKSSPQKVGANPQSSEEDALAEREAALTRLQRVPNVGPRMAADLVKLGITSLEEAAGRDSDEMYHELCAIDAKRHDPCVRDVFAAVASSPATASPEDVVFSPLPSSCKELPEVAG